MDHHVLPSGKRVKLGAKPATVDRRDMLLKTYLDTDKLLASEDVPGAIDWSQMPDQDGQQIPYDDDVLGNDAFGDCVFAGPGHQLRMIAALTGNQPPVPVTGDSTLHEYSLCTGFDPSNPTTDNGADIRDMLKRAVNVGMWGEKALAFAAIDMDDPVQRRVACWLGCGTINGYALPKYAQGAVDSQRRQLWDVPPGGFPVGQGVATWGGHCIWRQSDSPKLLGGNSWGEKTIWTPVFERACCEQSFVLLWPTWVLRSGRAPNGLALEDMLTDVAARARMKK